MASLKISVSLSGIRRNITITNKKKWKVLIASLKLWAEKQTLPGQSCVNGNAANTDAALPTF